QGGGAAERGFAGHLRLPAIDPGLGRPQDNPVAQPVSGRPGIDDGGRTRVRPLSFGCCETGDSRNGTLWNIGRDWPAPPGFMPASFPTLAPFSVSSAMSCPKPAGEPTWGVPPRSASRALILGSARAALISLLSLSTISAGVLVGTPNPNHWLVS